VEGSLSIAFCKFDGVMLALRARSFCTLAGAIAGDDEPGGGHGQSEAIIAIRSPC